MKPIEQVAREAYESCYRIAEVRNNSEYTHSLMWILHLHFVNSITVETGESVSEEAGRLIGELRSLEGEFYPKFKELERKQAELRR